MTGKTGGYTRKQNKFIAHYTEHHNLAAAAKYAGSLGKDSKSLSQCGRDLLDGLGMSFQEKLNAYGLTDEFLMKGIIEGCQSNKVEIATFQGKIKDEKLYSDMPTRGKYYDMLSRMKGVFIDRHELTGKDGGDITLVVAKASKRGVKELSFD